MRAAIKYCSVSGCGQPVSKNGRYCAAHAYKIGIAAPWKKGASGNKSGMTRGDKALEQVAALKVDLSSVIRQMNKFFARFEAQIAELATNQAGMARDFAAARIAPQNEPGSPDPVAASGERPEATPATEPALEPVQAPKKPAEEPSAPPEQVSSLGYTPRIVGEDSHICSIGPDGKVSYIAKDLQASQQCAAAVCEASNASDPRKHRR